MVVFHLFRLVSIFFFHLFHFFTEGVGHGFYVVDVIGLTVVGIGLGGDRSVLVGRLELRAPVRGLVMLLLELHELVLEETLVNTHLLASNSLVRLVDPYIIIRHISSSLTLYCSLRLEEATQVLKYFSFNNFII